MTAAVLAFKIVLKLELARRENDEKVIMLNAQMCDMMSAITLCVCYQGRGDIAAFSNVLYRLKEVANPKDEDKGGSIESRLSKRMGGEAGIIKSIDQCGKLCDSYQKRQFLGM